MGKQRKTKNIDLTVGNITSSLWKFAVPLMLGNVLQQLYNLVDTRSEEHTSELQSHA